MFPQFEDGALILLELQIFLLDFVDGDADDVDHVAEDGSADYLDDCYDDCFDVVAGGEISVAYGYHCCVCPVEGVDVELVPFFS